MTVDTVVGTPTPAHIDWTMRAGADFVVPYLWSKDGVPVDLTAAHVVIRFSAPPTGGRVPVSLSSSASNSEAGSIDVGPVVAGANMTVRIPAATTALYAFRTARYVMTVTYPGSGTLPWADGFVAFTDDDVAPG